MFNKWFGRVLMAVGFYAIMLWLGAWGALLDLLDTIWNNLWGHVQ